MCEIARNSVLQSGFPVADKKHWIGANYYRRGAAGNAVKQSNVPNIRLLFRDELLAEEENWILGLPPPIFPSIKLDTRWKTKKKSAKGKGRKLRRVSEHMNYLVAHRTNIPFNLHQEQSPQPPKAVLSPLKRKTPSKYDPLGYFVGKQKKEKGGKWELEGSDVDGLEFGGDDERTTVHVVTKMVKRHFVTVAIGVIVGVLATVSYQRSMEKDKSQNK